MSLFLPQFTRTLSHPLFIKKISNSLSCVSSVYIARKSHQTECGSFKRITNLPSMTKHFHSSTQRWNTESSFKDTENLKLLSAQMNMRLINENSFLSWCRNAYLSTVVGIAMMEQAASTLAQGAGFGAFLIGGMNLYWGTGCHVTNLIRLRHAAGMSTFNLTLNVLGSLLHCLLYSVVLIFYIGFLDERSGNSISGNVQSEGIQESEAGRV